LRIFVINLDRSPDRLAHITNEFSRLGLEFARIAAIDGNALSDEMFAHWTRERNWPKPLTRPEVGCFLSHRECLRVGVEQGDPYFAIFEDDVILSPHATFFLHDHAWIEPGIDIVKLDTASIKCLLQPLHKSNVASYRQGRLVSKHYCAGGYIVSRDAAIQLLATTEQAFAPIDEIYFNPDYDILKTLNIQQIVPAPVIQAGLVSTIRQPSQSKGRCKGHPPLRLLPQRLAKEIRRFYKRRLRPFFYKVVKGYHWEKIPFG